MDIDEEDHLLNLLHSCLNEESYRSPGTSITSQYEDEEEHFLNLLHSCLNEESYPFLPKGLAAAIEHVVKKRIQDVDVVDAIEPLIEEIRKLEEDDVKGVQYALLNLPYLNSMAAAIGNVGGD
ncbi:hypothetical protein L1887_17785 [Cichorium endivia]|nr:hypothetical protein L1887_17785 [Cichorium endivia]